MTGGHACTARRVPLRELCKVHVAILSPVVDVFRICRATQRRDVRPMPQSFGHVVNILSHIHIKRVFVKQEVILEDRQFCVSGAGPTFETAVLGLNVIRVISFTVPPLLGMIYLLLSLVQFQPLDRYPTGAKAICHRPLCALLDALAYSARDFICTSGLTVCRISLAWQKAKRYAFAPVGVRVHLGAFTDQHCQPHPAGATISITSCLPP